MVNSRPVLLDAALDPVRQQVGREGVQDRREYEVPDAGGARRVHGGEPHLAFPRMHRRADVVHAPDPVHRPRHQGGVGDVADHDLGHAGGAQPRGRRLPPPAAAPAAAPGPPAPP